MAVVYRYLRYGSSGEVPCDTVGRAFYAALCDREYNEAYPAGIERDGAVLYDEQAISDQLSLLYADYYRGEKGIHEVGAREPA